LAARLGRVFETTEDRPGNQLLLAGTARALVAQREVVGIVEDLLNL
jgi:hypothetical protein